MGEAKKKEAKKKEEKEKAEKKKEEEEAKKKIEEEMKSQFPIGSKVFCRTGLPGGVPPSLCPALTESGKETHDHVGRRESTVTGFKDGKVCLKFCWHERWPDMYKNDWEYS